MHFLNHLASHDAHWVLEFRFSGSSIIPVFMAGLWKLARGGKGGKNAVERKDLVALVGGSGTRYCLGLARSSVLSIFSSYPAFNLGLFQSILFYPDMKCGKVWREAETILNDL